MILGIRPETFEDAAFAPPELPTIDVEVVVLEELGSDAHVFFRVDATRIAAEALEARTRTTRRTSSRIAARSSMRASIRARRRASGTRCASQSIPSRFHFFDADTGASLLPGRRRAKRGLRPSR